jgi:hypothetical protein
MVHALLERLEANLARNAHAALIKIGAAGAVGHMILRMRNLLLCMSLALSCAALSAANKDAVKRAFADGKGVVHIVTADGVGHVFHPKKWQDGGGFENLQIASDGKTVGWLADEKLTPFESNTNYPTEVALELEIWRGGRVIQRLSPPAFAIRDWMFLKDGSEVAFHAAPSHGQEWYECALSISKACSGVSANWNSSMSLGEMAPVSTSTSRLKTFFQYSEP